MSLTFVSLGFAAVALALLATWLILRPFPKLLLTEEEWAIFGNSAGEGYETWAKANPNDAWFMVTREEDGFYHLSFHSKRGMRRFRKRWLPMSQTRLR